MKSVISRHHPNSRAHNWLIYLLFDRALDRVADRITGTVYDLGCGEMPYRGWVLQRATGYCGVDWGATLHELKADILADLNQHLPIEDAVADTVISFSVMEHLCQPTVMLSEAHRILRSGGWMILQVPFQWHVHEAPYDYFRYTRFGLHHLLTQAGFTDVDVQEMGGVWPMAMLKLNYQLQRLARGPRPLRWLIGKSLWPIFNVSQALALGLEQLWPASPGETVGYMVVARRP